MNPSPSRLFKAAIRAGKKQCGAWLQLGSPWTAEIFAQAEFDFVLIDYEHGPGDSMTLGDQLRAFNGSPTTVLVRVPGNDPDTVKRVLDAGAHGVMIPHVETGEEAALAVSSAKYPPRGIRGAARSPRAAWYGQKSPQAIAAADEETIVLVMVETAKAVENLADIIRTPDLDAVFLGPMDLATSIGHLADADHPDALALRQRILDGCLAAHMPLATISAGWPKAQAVFEQGYTMVTLMADGVALSTMARQQVSGFAEKYR